MRGILDGDGDERAERIVCKIVCLGCSIDRISLDIPGNRTALKSKSKS